MVSTKTWSGLKLLVWSLILVWSLLVSVPDIWHRLCLHFEDILVSRGYDSNELRTLTGQCRRGLGSQYYLTCLHTSCNVATFNVWLFNAWYSCFNSNWTLLPYIPFLLFAILLPCIWHLSFVHAGFSLCNALCHSSFYHFSYSVLPLFLLCHNIIASSMLTAIIHGKY